MAIACGIIACGIIVAGWLVLVGLCRIAGSILHLADEIYGVGGNIGKVAHEIHIHAETLNEIKHDGIGIDEKMTPGEKFFSDSMRGKKVK